MMNDHIINNTEEVEYLLKLFRIVKASFTSCRLVGDRDLKEGIELMRKINEKILSKLSKEVDQLEESFNSK